MFVIWHEARINFTYRIFYSAHTLWRQYCCLSDWLSVQLFALMHSSQVTFAFHTVCFLTIRATLISISIDAQKKCGGNCWVVKANFQTSWPWSRGEFASAVSWGLLWHLIPQLYRHLREQPSFLALTGNVPVWLVSHVPTHTHSSTPDPTTAHPQRLLKAICGAAVGMEVREQAIEGVLCRLLFSSEVDIAK